MELPERSSSFGIILDELYKSCFDRLHRLRNNMHLGKNSIASWKKAKVERPRAAKIDSSYRLD